MRPRKPINKIEPLSSSSVTFNSSEMHSSSSRSPLGVLSIEETIRMLLTDGLPLEWDDLSTKSNSVFCWTTSGMVGRCSSTDSINKDRNNHPTGLCFTNCKDVDTFDVEANDVAALVGRFHNRWRRNDGLCSLYFYFFFYYFWGGRHFRAVLLSSRIFAFTPPALNVT